jgi:hypothetical protein
MEVETRVSAYIMVTIMIVHYRDRRKRPAKAAKAITIKVHRGAEGWRAKGPSPVSARCRSRCACRRVLRLGWYGLTARRVQKKESSLDGWYLTAQPPMELVFAGLFMASIAALQHNDGTLNGAATDAQDIGGLVLRACAHGRMLIGAYGPVRQLCGDHRALAVGLHGLDQLRVAAVTGTLNRTPADALDGCGLVLRDYNCFN